MNTTVLPSFADSGWSSTGAGNRANFLGPDPDAPDLQMYSGSHYAAWRDLSALVPGHFYDMVFVVKPCGKEADGSLVPMALRFGTASSGTGKILYSGTVTPNIVVASGVTPILKAGSTITED